jgi:hypothetical protein
MVTMASTTAEDIDKVERRFCSTADDIDKVERRFCSTSAVALRTGFSGPSVGQPIFFAKCSISGVCGLFLLAWTRSRRLELRRCVDPVARDAGGVECVFFCGDSVDDFGFRFLRIVTFRINSMSFSRLGESSSGTSLLLASFCGRISTKVFRGVTSLSSLSNARPNPRISSTLLSRSSEGELDRLFSVVDVSSLAVLKDSGLDAEEGYANRMGRSGVDTAMDSVVRCGCGGLASGVGGLRWLTGVLSVDFLDSSDETRPSAWGGGLKSLRGRVSCEFDGGVGGRPESVPFTVLSGDAGLVVFWLLVWESAASSLTEEAGRLSGSAAGAAPR